LQNRTDTAYNDFIGKFYHFPKKYANLLAEPRIEFVYYEPKKHGEGAYFGYGKIEKVFADKREEDCFFAEITEYKPFSEAVPFLTPDGKPRESGSTYNAQNAVRRIKPDKLDGICLDGGIVLNFTADAHLLTVLGEQLISSEQVGILELVKNAYDAGATECVVRVEGVPSLQARNSEYEYPQYRGPVVVVRDNGRGMDRFTIEHGWLRPASTIKTDVKERLKEEKQRAIEKGSLGTFKALIKTLKEQHGGRLPLGEKGVGRFATHRLGRNVIIKTKTADSRYEYEMSIDWERFESSETGKFLDLDEIGVALFRKEPSRDYGRTGSGTELVIHGGRPEYPLTEAALRQINRTLNRLRSPSRGPTDFKVIFECPQIPNLEETPYQSLFPPVFTIDALVDETGNADFDLIFTPPRSIPLSRRAISKKDFSLRALRKDYWSVGPGQELKQPKCGSFFIHIDFWYRAAPWIDGPEKSAFIKYLDDFGGISIFRDGLNIFPAEWGAEVDWLELNKRHIRSGDRISYREMIGNLEIEQTSNLQLIDKTDRQGMIENDAYRDLSKLVQAIVLFVEIEFQGRRESFTALTGGIIREPKRLGDVTTQASTLLGDMAAKYNVEKDPFDLLPNFGSPDQRSARLIDLSRSLKNLQKSLKLMQDVQDLLTEQAGYGLSIAVSVHELAKLTANFYHSVSKLLKAKSLDRHDLERLQESSESFRTELKRLGPLRAVRNERARVFAIRNAIDYCVALFERRLKDSHVTLEIIAKDDFKVCARFGTTVQVFTNLVDNSCYWLDTKDSRDRRIGIKISNTDRIVIVADSGPGLDDAIRPYVFQPGYSLREPASGLGLYICKYYMRTLGGDIYETPLKDRLENFSGAQFTLDFGRVPAVEEE
jgi:signal transduction histidine kinase